MRARVAAGFATVSSDARDRLPPAGAQNRSTTRALAGAAEPQRLCEHGVHVAKAFASAPNHPLCRRQGFVALHSLQPLSFQVSRLDRRGTLSPAPRSLLRRRRGAGSLTLRLDAEWPIRRRGSTPACAPPSCRGRLTRSPPRRPCRCLRFLQSSTPQNARRRPPAARRRRRGHLSQGRRCVQLLLPADHLRRQLPLRRLPQLPLRLHPQRAGHRHGGWRATAANGVVERSGSTLTPPSPRAPAAACPLCSGVPSSAGTRP